MIHSGNAFLQKVAAMPGYTPLYGTPVLILFSGPVDDPLSTFNASLSAENMILQATGLGLGSCFMCSPPLALNNEANRDLAREAGIPGEHQVRCAVVLGHEAVENQPGTGERARKGSVTYVD